MVADTPTAVVVSRSSASERPLPACECPHSHLMTRAGDPQSPLQPGGDPRSPGRTKYARTSTSNSNYHYTQVLFPVQR